MANKTLAIIAGLSLVGLAFLVYLALTFEAPETTRTVELERPVPRPVERLLPEEFPAPVDQEPFRPVEVVPEPVTPPEPEPTPAEVADETPAEPVEPIPTLNNSDAYVLQRLAGMELGASLLRLMVSDEIIRKFVVFTHNVAEGDLPQLEYPLRRVQPEFMVREIDDNLYEMDTASFRRYNTLVDTLVALEPAQALRIYDALRPLFQEAYQELGYRDPFDQVLIEAIDRIMAARTVEGPFQLIKPSVMYIYAESQIEALTPVEKQLLRMGPENVAKLQARLPAYRERLQVGR